MEECRSVVINGAGDDDDEDETEDRGGAHLQQTRADFRREWQMAVPFHRFEQNRRQHPKGRGRAT